ncbi:MAG: pyruvate dehydrogenase complex dihydrolipoamide acetyltransferase [Gemmatimonadetes bacterium]|nr:pyruvate dehydrogenase complex dihydrolipoamide acetyltransferase [Gemmatimonadota bacterium]
MATKVYMEALSPTMEEGRLITWLKNEGDEIAEGDVLAEVETDKATMELVARGAGVLRKRMIGDGDTANVGTIIGVIASEDEDISSMMGADAATDQAASTTEAPDKVPDPEAAADAADADEADVKEGAAAVAAAGQTERDQAERGTAESTAPGEKPTPTPDRKTSAATGEGQPSIVQDRGAGDRADADGGNGRVKASPLARRLAEEAGLQIGNVEGSGPGGRIVKRDIEAAMQEGPGRAEAAEAAEAPAAQEAPVPAPQPAAAGGAYRDLPLTQMRKTIARRLTQSIGPIPHFFLTIEVDMGEAMALRKRINERFSDDGVKVSPNDLIIKAVAAALRRHPMVNASWTGEAIRQFDAVHIAIAVAVEEGLITPVVRDADRKGVTEISREVKELAGRGREKKLKPEEYTGSTFSISNLGMFGIEEFTAVINPPEAAILAVGAVGEKVVAENGEMVIRQRMRVTLSCDHRVIDGATGAQFLQTLKRYLEDPMMIIA